MFEQASEKRDTGDRRAVAFNEVLATFTVALAHLRATKLEGKGEALASFVEPLGAVKRILEGTITGYEAELAGFKAFPAETTPRLEAACVRCQATVLDLIAETRGFIGTVRTVQCVVAGESR